MRCDLGEFCMQTRALFSDDPRASRIIAKTVVWFLDISRETLRGLNFQDIDGSALMAILRATHHCSSTLQNFDVQLMPAWLPFFSSHIDGCVHEGMAAAAEGLEQELRRTLSAVSGEGDLLEISKFRPLAVFYAEAVNTLNELRLCPVLSCEAAARQSLEISSKRAEAAVESSRRPDAAEMARVFQSALRPVLVSYVDKIFS
jgi:hypothetical protein